MIHYKINFDNHSKQGVKYRPGIDFEHNYWWLSELNSCDMEYVLDDILPNLEKIMNGELIQDPSQIQPYLTDCYSFGYDATIIDFYKDKSVINYNYFEDQIEVPSQDIYQFMMEWGQYLRKWKESHPVGADLQSVPTIKPQQ